MRISKNISESQLTSIEVVTQNQTDRNGRMWASELLAWIEKMATFTAQIHADGESVAVVHLEQMNFKHALRAGTEVVLTSRVIRVVKSSMDIEVTVQRGAIARALLTFVSLDRLSKPAIVPGLNLETDEEKYLFAESNL